MKFGNQLNNVKVVCINLKCRKDKKKYMKKQLKRRKLDFKFFNAEKHANPKRGCLESHLTVIEDAIKEGYKSVLIFEDDVKFKRSLSILSQVPEDWDMLYLGGTVHRIMNKDNKNWARVSTWTTHAYLINLENEKLINKIRDSRFLDLEIDRYYIEKIHKSFNCYMANPMVAIQREGFSDIEGQVVNYNFMEKTLEGLMSPEHEEVNGNYVLKLPDISPDKLPSVSIITPTYDRRKLFYMAIRNFENFNYPKEKLEWIIIDDTPEDLDQIDDILPTDDRIKYLKIKGIKQKLTVAHKRNLGVAKATNDIIIHMDDDDYYPPESVIARVKALIKYAPKGIECVGCTKIGTYDLISKTSSMSTDGPISLSEASMAYSKQFWHARNFDETCQRGEHKYFTENRLHKILDLPYSFIIIALNHRKNITGKLRENSEDNILKKTGTNEHANYYDMWDEDLQMFMDALSSSVKYVDEEIEEVSI